MRGSIGGVTVGNDWMYNNPELVYPEGFDDMSESEQLAALKHTPDDEIQYLIWNI